MRAGLAFLLLASGACRAGVPRDWPAVQAATVEPELPGRHEPRTQHDRDTGGLLHEWRVWIVPGRGAIKDGVERIWHRNGNLHWEREFARGKPTGTWKSWYEDGTPRAECHYRGPTVETTMSFWFEDGQLSAQGPAADGARRGLWRFWWRNGRLAEQGAYREGMKEGIWQAWSEDGSERWERVYERNTRVSQKVVEGSGP